MVERFFVSTMQSPWRLMALFYKILKLIPPFASCLSRSRQMRCVLETIRQIVSPIPSSRKTLLAKMMPLVQALVGTGNLPKTMRNGWCILEAPKLQVESLGLSIRYLR